MSWPIVIGADGCVSLEPLERIEDFRAIEFPIELDHDECGRLSPDAWLHPPTKLKLVASPRRAASRPAPSVPWSKAPKKDAPAWTRAVTALERTAYGTPTLGWMPAPRPHRYVPVAINWTADRVEAPAVYSAMLAVVSALVGRVVGSKHFNDERGRSVASRLELLNRVYRPWARAETTQGRRPEEASRRQLAISLFPQLEPSLPRVGDCEARQAAPRTRVGRR